MHTPRKRFGQHFLEDKNVIANIIAAINPKDADALVEIGPGEGALTLPLLRRMGTLHAIELDRDLIPLLEEMSAGVGELILHQADVLRFDFNQLYHDKPLRIVGNLPYNISTPLIFHLLDYANKIDDMHFMLQKEVVDRLAAKPGSKDYGRLSIMVQYHCNVYALFDVPPAAFNPPPKVMSAIVRMVPLRELPFIANDFNTFSRVVKTAFAQRRKTLRNALHDIISDEIWEKSQLNSKARAEELSVQDYVTLSNLV